MLSLLGGCVGVTEPVAGVPGEEIDLSPFVGSWGMVKGSDVQHYEFTDTGSNTLMGSVLSSEGSDEPITFTVSVSKINGRIIASGRTIQDYLGLERTLWAVTTVDLNDDGTRMTIRDLSAEVIEKAVKSGDLDGTQLKMAGVEAGIFMIEADGEALRTYLGGHPEAFAQETNIELVRGSRPANLNPAHGPTPTAVWGRAETMRNYPYPDAESPDLGEFGSSSLDEATTDPPTSTPVAAGVGEPNAAGSVEAAEADRPASLDRLLAALVLVIFVGVIAGIALNTLREPARGGPEVEEGSGQPAPMDSSSGYAVAERLPGDSTHGPPGVDGAFGRYVWPALLILAVAVGPILYLTVLLGGLMFPEWAGHQAGAQAMLHGFAPYLLVFSIGAMFAAAEVATSFPAFSAEALGTKWATLIVLFNALGTAIIYSAVMAYASSADHPLDHPLLRAIAIAVGFAVLIRTRFVLARDLRAPVAGEGVSVDLGWPYARIQQMCRQRIDRDLLHDPRYATARLLALFPGTAELEQLAVHAIDTHDLSEAADLRTRLDAIRAEDIAPDIVRARIARFVVDTEDFDETRFLLEHANTEGGA